MTNKNRLTFSPDVDLAPIRGASLFYPSAGADADNLVELFDGWLSTFHLQDRRYAEHLGLDPHRAVPSLLGGVGSGLLSDLIEEETLCSDRSMYCSRCMLSATGAPFQICIDSRAADEAWSNISGPIGVFVTRSSNAEPEENWNRWPRLYRVFDRLVDGGLFISDGEGAGPLSSRAYRRHRPMFEAAEAMAGASWRDFLGRSFKNRLGLHFTCVGYGGTPDRPTLIWQVRHV